MSAESRNDALPDPVADPVARPHAPDTLAQVLGEGAKLLAGIAGARAAVVLLSDGDGTTHEGWHVARLPLRAPLRARLRRLALDPRPAAKSADARTRVWRLEPGAELHGAIVLEFTRAPRTSAIRDAQLDRAIRLLTGSIRSHRLHSSQHAAAEQQERWFWQLDQQVRVLDRERQKLAAVVNQSDTYVFVTDLDCTIRWANRTLSVHTPVSDADGSWVGHTCREVCSRFTSGASHCGQCPVARALETNHVAHHEFRETAGGRVRTLYLSALPITDVSGRPQEALVMMQDLTDLETLRESEERYRVVTQAASDGIVTVDEQGRIIFVNDAVERIFGYPPEELVGHPLALLMAPEFLDRQRSGLASDLTIGAKRMAADAVRVPARHKSGREIILDLSFGQYVKDGKRLFTGVMRDITDRRMAEIELKRAQEQLRMVVSSSPIVLFAIDRSGRFTLSEGRGLASLGLEPGQVVGRSAFEMYADAPGVIDQLRRALAGEEHSTVVEIGTLAFDTCYTPIRDETGEVCGVIGVATDVTERRELEHQLRHAQKMEAVGRLAAGVAHDFNNRLTTILGYSSLLLQRQQADETPDRGLVEIKRAAERASELTRQLLAFSRRQVVEPRVLDLNQVVSQIEEMLGRLIGGNIRLVIEPASEPAPVRADQGQLEQVLMNLVVNARDAMPRGGDITIAIEHTQLAEPVEQGDVTLPPGPCVALTVRDDGCGMDAGTMARIFEPFFTSKAFGQGTGLGLAIVYGIVQQTGGHVAVRSRPGEGASFVITLPRAEGMTAVADGAASQQTGAGTETVLLVEDEDPVRTLAHEMLTTQGYVVLAAARGDEALRLVERHAGPIDLVVTDVVMPGMDGGELVHRLMRVRPELRVLYISGYSDDAIVRQGVSDADCAFLQKPFTCEAFVAKVREVMDAPAPRRKAA